MESAREDGKEKTGKRLFTIYICRPTGRFMVWVNGKQNLERENFAPESRLSFAQISHLPKNGRENLNWVSKMAFKKWNTNFPLKHFVLKKGTTFLEIPLLQDFFHWKYPKCRVPVTFQPDFLETISK